MINAKRAAKRAGRRPRPAWKPKPATPILKLTPTAWAKLLYLRDLGPTEVGGFGISAEDDLLLVEDVQLIRQHSTYASVEFEDEAVADFVDRQVDLGLRPERFSRIWVHTHPGDSAEPSCTDEATFARCFGGSSWALMLILARGGQTYARLRFNVGPGGHRRIPVEVDYRRPFPASDRQAWEQEYLDNVEMIDELQFSRALPLGDQANESEPPSMDIWHDQWPDFAFDPQAEKEALHDEFT